MDWELFRAELVKPLGIHGRHFSVLAVLGEEKLSLVKRERDPRDRRVTLTDRGREVLIISTVFAKRTNDEVFAPLSGEERAQLHSLLSRLF